MTGFVLFLSVSLEKIPAVDFVLYFVQAGIITVGDDTVALLFNSSRSFTILLPKKKM